MKLLFRYLISVARCGMDLVLTFESMSHWRLWYVISLEKYWLISVPLLLYIVSLLVLWYHSCCICLLLFGVNHCCNEWCGGRVPFFCIFRIVFNMFFHVFYAAFEGLDWYGQVNLGFGYAGLFSEETFISAVLPSGSMMSLR